MNRKSLTQTILGMLLMLWPFVRAGAQSTGLEYWFDQYKDPKVIGMPTAEGTLTSRIDVNRLTQGFHTIYMRVKSNGTYSPVTSTTFIKFTTTGDDKSALEYWFDQDFDKKSSIPINVTSEGDQVVSLDLTDAVSFPYGLHRLNMRVVVEGGHYSPIYSSLVMQLPEGQKNELIYWLDDDYQNGRHVMKAKKIQGKDALFDTTLDLSSVTPGMHHFKYRITTNGFDVGVVYEVPVLITQRYNSQGEVFVIGESRWVDDVASPVLQSLSNPQSLMTLGYVLNPSDYSNGQHVFYVQYKNSADVWSAANATYFYKEAATGRLVKGFMPDIEDGIVDAEMSELMNCVYNNGTIIVECQSARLASEGILVIYDLMGRVLAQEKVKNTNGIHAEVSVPGNARQMLVVKLISGSVVFTKKLARR